MRVALVSRTARTGDAIGNQVAEKLSLFLERGADVRVFLETLEDLHPQVGPHAQQLQAEALGSGWDFVRSADLVCFEFGQFYSFLSLLPLLASGHGRILIDYHGITPPALWGPHNRQALEKGLAYRGLAWCADATLVHSRCMKRELIDVTGIAPERVRQIGLPVDAEQYCPGPTPRPFLQSLGLENATRLLYVGRLAANKRVPLLVEVLARLGDVLPPVHLLIVGDTADIYQVEADRCRDLARELGVADRVHFLGRLTGEPLRQAYQAADVLVMPSAWESFSVPVVEAMACGVPVVAARAFALPETAGAAGLTFRLDDPADCAWQIRRVLGQNVATDLQSAVETITSAACKAAATTLGSRKRLAIVSFRYGADFAGGAEWSLRRIATALRQAGHHIGVFATCNRAESAWRNELPPGTTYDGDIPVHRFPLAAHDRRRHLKTYQAVVEADGHITPQMEEDYLAHSIHSPVLIEELRKRAHEFDVIITGPYLFGLTHDVAREFPDKTLLLPCFHDEPLARLATWPAAYGSVAGMLYHSPEEQEFAQAELGVNVPRSTVVGTWMDVADHTMPAQYEDLGRYLIYCGRYSEQKELPQLLTLARQYQERQPGRFRFVFIGQGETPIPREDWARDMGFVSPADKQDLIGGAAALLQLSRKESLSLVALEAWSLGTPVIANCACAVLARHLERCDGGAAVGDFESFAAILDDLWENPGSWRTRGLLGREYVRQNYASSGAYVRRLEQAIEEMKLPLRELMCRRGLERARMFHRSVWRESFGSLVDGLLHGEPRIVEDKLEIRPRRNHHTASLGTTSALLSMRLINNGSILHIPEGPGRTVLRACVVDSEREPTLDSLLETPIPGVILPGMTLPAAVPVRIPSTSGRYTIHVSATRAGSELDVTACRIDLIVEAGAGVEEDGWCAPFVESARAALAEAFRLRRLPDDYVDVTQGWLARAKRWLKRKLLNNFKLAYVDVLSRQQTQVNEKLVTALQDAVEWCGTLEHALNMLQERVAVLEKGQTSPRPPVEDGVSALR